MVTLVGVFPLYDESKQSIWMVPGYMDGLREAGAVPIILPLIADDKEIKYLCSLCDGFLFTGGHDINPNIYGEEKKKACGLINEDRDLIETKVFQQAYKLNKPMLGICRGIQLMNGLLGGTLYQDLPTEYDSNIIHVMKAPYNRTQHNVNLVENTPLQRLLHIDKMGVNSYHHQAIKELAKDLSPMAYSVDGLVEACYSKTKKFLWAVQWHPEFLYQSDENSKKIFKEFIRNCKK